MIKIIQHHSPGRPVLISASMIEGLSLEAMGLYNYLASRPPDWKIQKDYLINQFGSQGTNALNELIDAGHIKMEESCQD